MLKQVLSAENQIRLKKENEREVNNIQSHQYAKIFEPVTESLKTSVKEATPHPPTVKTHHQGTVGKLIDLEEGNIMDSSIDSHLPLSLSPERSEKSKREGEESVNPSIKAEQHEAIQKNEAPGTIFLSALESIPIASRDDGVFGLNVKSNRIGSYRFSIHGNTLHVFDENGNAFKQIPIHDYKTWQLLLVKRPRDIGLELKNTKGQNIQAVRTFSRIADDLGLIQSAIELGGGNYKNRSKFKVLVSNVKGSGFLYSYHTPGAKEQSKIIHPSTIVIPSNKARLLRTLIKSVAELRAGNTSMQNIVAPFARAAKQRGILPPNLLSPSEMTWVFT